MVANLKLVLLGPPACGKGTQATLLSEHLGLPAVSTGVIIRAEIARGTTLGEKARGFLADGRLLPDPETLEIVESWLGESGGDGFILDGFPRTVPQAEAFDHMLEKRGTALDAALYLDVPRALLEERIFGRLQCTGCGRVFQASAVDAPGRDQPCPACGARVGRRDDDNAETFALRYAEYEAKTFGLVSYYGERKILKTIDGQGSPAKVLADVFAALGLALPAFPPT